MFEIFGLSQRSPEEIILSIALLAVLFALLGYASDALIERQGFGPGGNGLVLIFGALVGISAYYLYLRFADGVLAANRFKAHMFDADWAVTALAASAGGLSFLLFMVFVKRST